MGSTYTSWCKHDNKQRCVLRTSATGHLQGAPPDLRSRVGEGPQNQWSSPCDAGIPLGRKIRTVRISQKGIARWPVQRRTVRFSLRHVATHPKSRSNVGIKSLTMHSSIKAAHKYGTRILTVTQTLGDLERHTAKLRKTAAFEEWRQKLNRGDRLPRGRYFVGKSPGRIVCVFDEFALYSSVNDSQ